MNILVFKQVICLEKTRAVLVAKQRGGLPSRNYCKLKPIPSPNTFEGLSGGHHHTTFTSDQSWL